MREQEMRLRVFRFLRTRMRHMLMPATVGLGITVAACSSNPVNSKYMGPIPEDASHSQPEAGSKDSLASQRDLAFGAEVQGADSPAQGRRDAHAAQDVAVDAMAAIDVSSAPDATLDVQAAGVDGAGADANIDHPSALDAGLDLGQDAGQAIAKYVAPQPDAGPDGMPVLRYQAPMLDGSLVVPMYMAPSPT
jgi:hypothetical protein